MKKVSVTKIIKEVTSMTLNGENEPYCIKILKSGWNDEYHVISEWGDTGEVKHDLLTSKQIIEIYEINLEDLPNNNLLPLTKDEIISHPNNYDLGEFIRKKL